MKRLLKILSKSWSYYKIWITSSVRAKFLIALVPSSKIKVESVSMILRTRILIGLTLSSIRLFIKSTSRASASSRCFGEVALWSSPWPTPRFSAPAPVYPAVFFIIFDTFVFLARREARPTPIICSWDDSFWMSWLRERKPKSAALLFCLSCNRGTMRAQNKTLIIRECFLAINLKLKSDLD